MQIYEKKINYIIKYSKNSFNYAVMYIIIAKYINLLKNMYTFISGN